MRFIGPSAILSASLLAFTVAPAMAQDGDAPTATAPAADPAVGGDSITVGAGVGYVPSYEGSNDYVVAPIPAARGTISGYAFALQGRRLSADLIRNEPGPVVDFQIGPIVGFSLNRVNRIRDDRVEALGKKKLAIEVGGYVGIGKTGVLTSPYDKITLSASYTHDVTNVYDSYLITPELSYGTPLSRRAFVAISGSATYAGRGYARSYFTVTPAGSVASGLPFYVADKGWKDWTASALGSYAVTGDLLGGLSVVGGISYTRLLNDFARSPITRIAGDKDQWFGALGLAYTF